MPDELLSQVKKVQQRLRQGRYQNESAVRIEMLLNGKRERVVSAMPGRIRIIDILADRD